MVKKLFALASVSALAGLVSAVSAAGCTTTETTTPGATDDASTSADAKKDSKTTTPPDEDAGEETPPTCITKDDVDQTQIPYAKATRKTGACTTAEAGDIKKFLDDAIAAKKLDFKQSEWAAVVSTGCAACVFTNADAAEWGPIINKADDPEVFQSYNRGGCVEIQSNNFECGQAYQQFQQCALVACNECKTQEDFDACLDDEGIYSGPCKNSLTAAQTECGKNVGAYETACKGGLDTLIKTHCISPKGADGGDGG